MTGHSLTIVNSHVQPLGLTNLARQSDSNLDQKRPLKELFDVAKQDMDTLEKLIGQN